MADTLLIRADGSPQLGAGHVMRCLALAQRWHQHGGHAIFAQAETTPALTRRLEGEGFVVRKLPASAGTAADASATIALARKLKAGWIAGDSYELGASWQKRVRAAGRRLLVLDDYGHARHYRADFVLNQNLRADPALYRNREPFSRLLLGPRYALLRHEFLRFARWEREIRSRATKLLVTLGGSDPDNVTAKVLEGLSSLPGLETVVVAGGSNPNLGRVKAAVTGVRGARLAVDAADMPDLMAWADVAIAGGGSTAWELAFMGLPALVLVLADNQEGIAAALDRERVAVNLGAHRDVPSSTIAARLEKLLRDASEREQVSRRGRRLVDGQGSARVVTRLLAEGIRLRRARPVDCRRLWEWANDREVRDASFSTAPIPWEDHARWFERKLKDPFSAIFIAADRAGREVGQVRLEWPESDKAFVDVSAAPGVRGTGLGSAMIRRAADEAFATLPVTELHAFIKPENQRSIRAFANADFSPAPAGLVKGQEVVHFQAGKATD